MSNDNKNQQGILENDFFLGPSHTPFVSIATMEELMLQKEILCQSLLMPLIEKIELSCRRFYSYLFS
jgi:hypothetical protein